MGHRPLKTPPNDELDNAIKARQDSDLPEEPETAPVPKPAAAETPVKIHTTIPIDQSMAKLKARRKPKKAKETVTKGDEDDKSKNASDGRVRQPAADAGSGKRSDGGIRFPFDLFNRR